MAELTREEALEHLGSDYGGLRVRLERWTEEEADRLVLVGQWSARQLLAHVVAWEEEALKRLRLIAAGQEDQILPIKATEVDDWNAAAVARLGGVPWTALLARWSELRAELVQCLATLTDERFAAPGRRLRTSRWLPTFAWAHEAEHANELPQR